MEVLSFGPKQLVNVKSYEMSFLADFDKCLTELGGRDAEKINELNTAAVWNRSLAKKNKGSRILDRAKMFLKRKSLKVVPFDKGTGF